MTFPKNHWMPLACASLAVLLCFGWQALSAHFNYGSNWTAFFCTGAKFHLPPPELASDHIYVFPNSSGYDGQVYHYIAHDPWVQRGFASYIDAPTFRYRRILIPGLAWLLAFGQDRFVDLAYYSLILLAVFAGVYWTALLCGDRQISPLWSLLFLLVPAIPISLDRMILDGALAALTLGFVLYSARDAKKPLWMICLLAALVRELGALFAVAVMIRAAIKRDFRTAAVFATSAVPAVSWYVYLRSRLTDEGVTVFSVIPFKTLIFGLFHPREYPPEIVPSVRYLATALDWVALAGMLLAIGFVSLRGRKLLDDAPGLVILFWTMVIAFIAIQDMWSEAFGYGRAFSPWLALIAALAVREKRLLPILPMLLMIPRIGLQFGGQVLGIVKGLLS